MKDIRVRIEKLISDAEDCMLINESLHGFRKTRGIPEAGGRLLQDGA
jgi:hypothetical protein